MFLGAASFGGDISTWDVSSVTGMVSMFSYTRLFNSDISKWDVSSVKDMSAMFLDAFSFNVDISKWDISNVVNMDYMFMNAAAFDKLLCAPAWVSSTASRESMFEGVKQEQFGAAQQRRSNDIVSPGPPGRYDFGFGRALEKIKSSKKKKRRTMCPSESDVTTTAPSLFLPRNRSELKDAVDACLGESR